MISYDPGGGGRACAPGLVPGQSPTPFPGPPLRGGQPSQRGEGGGKGQGRGGWGFIYSLKLLPDMLTLYKYVKRED